MTELLGDEKIYRKLNKDFIKRIATKLNELIKSWLDNDIDNHTI